MRQETEELSRPTLCILDEEGNANPLWKWCYLPYWHVKELEAKGTRLGAQDLIQTASEFIEENEELLEDPEVSIHVLQAILMQGAPIGTELAGETRRLMDVAIPPANKLEDAIKSKELSPKEIAVLAAEHKRTQDEYEAAYVVLIRFNEFLKKTQDLYEREQEDEQAIAEEMEIPAAVFGDEDSRAAAQQLAKETEAILGNEEFGIYELSLPPPLPEKIEIVRAYFFN